MTELTKELLIELLDYNADTGIFIWKRRDGKHFKTDRACKIWNTRFAGKKAGCKSEKRKDKFYIVIGVKARLYHAHRLAWLYVTGSWPDNENDHDNGDGLFNAFSNLRDVKHIKNSRNLKLKKTNTTGVNGVYFNKQRSKYEAYIHVSGKKLNLGRFDALEEAKSARSIADIKHGFHKSHGTVRYSSHNENLQYKC